MCSPLKGAFSQSTADCLSTSPRAFARVIGFYFVKLCLPALLLLVNCVSPSFIAGSPTLCFSGVLFSHLHMLKYDLFSVRVGFFRRMVWGAGLGVCVHTPTMYVEARGQCSISSSFALSLIV